MKLMVLISFTCLTRISGLDYSAIFGLEEITIWNFNQYFDIEMPNPPQIRELIVKRTITEEDEISIDYRVQTKKGELIKSAEDASFCGADAGTEGGAIAEVVRKILGIEESNCPIAEQTHTLISGTAVVDILNTDIDTKCGKFWVIVFIRVHRSTTPLAQLEFSVVPRDCKSEGA